MRGTYDRGVRSVRLRPFTSPDLPLVEPWFADADTQRWLGGPGWPRLVLTGRPLGEYRGAVETGNYDWLATDDELVVGYIGCGTYDRWTTWEGGPGGRGVMASIDVPAANISYVVDPARRRRGCIGGARPGAVPGDLGAGSSCGRSSCPEAASRVRTAR